MPYQVTLNNLQNVAPGSTATLTCYAGPGAPTYDQIKLILSGGMLASDIQSIRGRINGRIFCDESSGSILQTRDAYRGIASDTSIVVIDFTEPKSRNGAAEQLMASVPGALCQSLTFEIKISSGAAANGKIKAVAMIRPPTTTPYVRKVFSTSQSFASAGTDAAPNIINLPVGAAGGRVKRIWIHESVAGVTTGVQVRIANNVMHEAQRVEIENDQKRNALTPQAGIVVLDWISDGNLAGVLDTSKTPNAELRLVNSAAVTYTVFMEYIDAIGNL